jgi:hypothetical protein
MAKEMTDLDIKRLIAGVDDVKYMPWPGTGTSEDNPAIMIAIRPLTREDILLAASRAETECKDRGISDRVIERVERPDGTLISIQAWDLVNRDEQLAISLRRGDDLDVPLFRNAKELRLRLTAAEVHRLYDIVVDHTSRSMPMTAEQHLLVTGGMNEVIDQLKKDPGSTIADGLPRDTLLLCMRRMASLLSR